MLLTDDKMTEEYFWGALEYRISDELSGMEDPRLNCMCCDGICGGIIRPQSEPAYISGTVWIGPEGQTEMQFTMTLPEGLSSGDELPWQDLFPPDNLTGWLHVDYRKRRVAIDLSKGEKIEL
ncbi:MAG: hypothetical protein ABL901_04115 [Hyphomicrobiaceae bacterium]